MKLYLFETCPFCVRIRMMLGLKQIPCEMVYLSGDDVETPMSLIGSKQVPILETDERHCLGESLDIIRYLDQLDGEPILNGKSVMPELEDWYTGVRKEITVNEFFLFPIVRSLTLIKALDMTAKLELYVQDLSQRCQVSLYSDSAI